MNMYFILGVICGGAIGVILLLILKKANRKSNSKRCEFDERQALVRGRGCQFGFITLVVYNAVAAVLLESAEFVKVGILLILFGGIILSVLVYVSYCIWNDSYFALNENPKRVMVSLGAVGLFNLGIFTMNMIQGYGHSRHSFVWLNLMCGLMIVVVLSVLEAKQIKNRWEAE